MEFGFNIDIKAMLTGAFYDPFKTAQPIKMPCGLRNLELKELCIRWGCKSHHGKGQC